MMQSMHLGLAVWCTWMRCLRLMLCSPRLTCSDDLDGYVASATSTWCLPNVDLTTFSFQSQVAPDRPKETMHFPWREAHRLDVLPRHYPTSAV
jgi:hypothetical protein